MMMVSSEGRRSTARKALLYLGQLTALAACIVQAIWLMTALLARAFGEDGVSADAWRGQLIARAAGAGIALALWALLRWLTIRDGDFGHETGRGANWRRAYFYTAASAGYALLVFGAVGFLRSLLSLAGQFMPIVPAGIAPVGPWRDAMLATLVVGALVGILSWLRSTRVALGAPEIEFNALSRVTLECAGILFGTAATMVSLGLLLRQAFLLLLGRATGTLAGYWENALVTPLAYLSVGVFCWLAFAGMSRGDLAHAAESFSAAGVRRFSNYLVAAVALGLFWYGLTELLRLILLGATSAFVARALVGQQAVDRFAWVATFVLLGVPVWWGHWWSRHVRAREAGSDGHAERASRVRRGYLAIVTWTAALVTLAALAMGVYRTLNWWARGEGYSSLAMAIAGWFAAFVIALVVWAGHAAVAREDKRWLAAERVVADAKVREYPETPASRSFSREELASLALNPAAGVIRPVVVIDGGDGTLGAAFLAGLRAARPGALLWPIGLNATAQAAMLNALGAQAAPEVPSDALARAEVVVGPSDILIPGGLNGQVGAELAMAAASSPACVLLLPPRDPRLRWVAAPDWPAERWIEYAVAEIAEVLRAD